MPRSSANIAVIARRRKRVQADASLSALLIICPYCAEIINTEVGLDRHIEKRHSCNLEHQQARLRRKLATRSIPDQTGSQRSQIIPAETNHPIIEDQDVREEPVAPILPPEEDFEDESAEPCETSSSNWTDNNRTTTQPYIESFPCASAGAPINNYLYQPPSSDVYLSQCGPLADVRLFEIAEVLMRTGLTNAGRTIHLQSPLYRGNTPWTNNGKLLNDVDKLPHGPPWYIYEISTGGDPVGRFCFLFGHNILDIVRDIIGNPRFKQYMHFSPERHYTNASKEVRIYGEMWIADWWWRMQLIIQDPFATIIPLIISSDKTCLTTIAGGVQAYPVFVSVGNISKGIRRKTSMRATVLLGYLPVEDFKDVTDLKLRQQLKGELRHRAMEKLLEPLKQASKDGIVMWCADGQQRCVYPILAAYVGDWPEQNNMACSVRSGCPVCTVTKDFRGDYPLDSPLRQQTNVLSAINDWRNGSITTDKLQENGLKPWWPFWADLPFVNLGTSFTPDLLHQIHKGLFWSHLMEWIADQSVLGKKADLRFKSMPRVHGMKHFTRGVYSISQWTGRETKEMIKQFLPVIVDDVHSDVVGLACALLDFIYYAHSAQLTEIELQEMSEALARFHELKPIIAKLELEKDGWWNEIPKLHMLIHYARAIREYGTPDGYNTETSEYLHIEFAKTPFRKSNKNRTYMLQILKFIQRQEAIQIHRAYLENLYGHFAQVPKAGTGGDDAEDDEEDKKVDETGSYPDAELEEETNDESGDGSEPIANEVEEGIANMNLNPLPTVVAYFQPELTIAVKPTRQGLSGVEISQTYGASDLIRQVTRFLDNRGCRHQVNDYNLFNVYHKFTLCHPPLPFAPEELPSKEIIRAYPATKTNRGHITRVEQFDTVLFLEQPDKFGIHRYRAGRVQAIFTLPGHVRDKYPAPLAYLELFTPFGKSDTVHRMYPTSRSQFEGKRRAIVIPLSDVVSACHLGPRFRYLPEGTILDSNSDLLSQGTKFFLNHYHSYHMRHFIEYWRHMRPME